MAAIKNFDSEVIQGVADNIKRWLDGRKVTVSLTLGSGLNGFGKELPDAITESYGRIGLPRCTCQGHAGLIRFVPIGEQGVLIFDGRVHLYEGRSVQEVVMGVRAAALLGIETHILTCASGSLDDALKPGKFVVIGDHLDLTGENPLVGLNDDSIGPRFPDMTEVYDKKLISLAISQREKLGLNGIPEGTWPPVYAAVKGPCYETRAQIIMLKAIGVGLVGMSTVSEATALRHMNKRVLAISLITNWAAGCGPLGAKHKLTHEEVDAMGKEASPGFARLITAIINNLP